MKEKFTQLNFITSQTVHFLFLICCIFTLLFLIFNFKRSTKVTLSCAFGTCLVPVSYRFVSISIGIFPYVFLPQTSFPNQKQGNVSFSDFLKSVISHLPGVPHAQVSYLQGLTTIDYPVEGYSSLRPKFWTMGNSVFFPPSCMRVECCFPLRLVNGFSGLYSLSVKLIRGCVIWGCCSSFRTLHSRVSETLTRKAGHGLAEARFEKAGTGLTHGRSPGRSAFMVFPIFLVKKTVKICVNQTSASSVESCLKNRKSCNPVKKHPVYPVSKTGFKQKFNEIIRPHFRLIYGPSQTYREKINDFDR